MTLKHRISLGICTIALAFMAAGQAHAVLVAEDNYDFSGGLSYGQTTGTGLGAHQYIEGTDGGIFHETSSRLIDGSGSLGVFAGNGGQALGRSFTDTSAFTAANPIAILDISLRFDINNNNNAFSGFNLKSAFGSSFGANELISFVMTTANGNNSVLVTGSEGKVLNLGQALPGEILDVNLEWNTLSGDYTLSAGVRSQAPSVVTGSLKSDPGTYIPGVIGFANFNTGTNQNVIYDNISLQAVPEASAFLAVGLAGAVAAGMSWVRGRRRIAAE